MANDLSIQLRYLLDEAPKVNLSAVYVCVCVCVCVFWSSVQQKHKIVSRREEWYIPQSHGQWKDFRTTYKFSCHTDDLVKQSL